MRLQRPFSAPQELELDKNPGKRLFEYAGYEIWDNRAVHALRALRIFSSEYINELVPNPEQKKWQKFAELLIPVFISYCIAFTLSYNPDESIADLGTAIAAEMFTRLLVVQLFLEKKIFGILP